MDPSLIKMAVDEFRSAARVLEDFMQPSYMEQVVSAAQLMACTLSSGHKILSCGNGGSACDAMHFAEELSGRFRSDRRPLAALSLHDSAHMSCVANDYGFEYVFARYLEALGQPGDLLLAISTSGRSVNVLKAVDAADRLQMRTVVLTGQDGGLLNDHSDVKIIVPHVGFSDRIQEIHIKIIHVMVLLVEKSLNL